jgi:replicative DNA helicase
MSDTIKLPPKSEEAEVCVLGSILIDNDSLLDITEFLRPEHFYNPNYGKIYEAMTSLYDSREPVDIVTVSEKLKELKVLKKIGGKAFLAQLANEVPTSANVESYGKIIKSLSAKRELISAASRLSEKAFDEGLSADELMDIAEQEIFTLTQNHIKNIPVSLKEVLTASFDRLDELQKLGSG